MSKFFDDTMQGLLEAIAIKNEEIMCEKKEESASTIADSDKHWLLLDNEDDLKNIKAASPPTFFCI